VVKLIFDKYTQEGFGTHRITTWLNEQGYRARTGKPWHAASIRGILNNLTYAGVLRSGESRSELLPELRIVSEEQFSRARSIMLARSEHWKKNNTVPLNTKGQSLLAGKERTVPLTTPGVSATPVTAKPASKRNATGKPATPCTFWTI